MATKHTFTVTRKSGDTVIWTGDFTTDKPASCSDTAWEKHVTDMKLVNELAWKARIVDVQSKMRKAKNSDMARKILRAKYGERVTMVPVVVKDLGGMEFTQAQIDMLAGDDIILKNYTVKEEDA